MRALTAPNPALENPKASAEELDKEESEFLANLWNDLKTHEADKLAFAKIADRANQALAILDTYSNLLSKLTSDNYTTALNAGATELSQSLDKEIATYNTTKHLTGADAFPSIGSLVGGVIRGAGGIWLRHEQETALKLAVTSADPKIAVLTDDIVELMAQFTKNGTGLIDGDRATIQQWFTTAGKISFTEKRKIVLSYDALSAFATQLESLDATQRLAENTSKAAADYEAAHKALAKAVNASKNAQESVQAAIDQIVTLETEVQAGLNLKSNSVSKTSAN